MAKQNINVGTKANDKAGDPLRTAFTKINDNFTELYTLTGGTSTALTELAQDYAAPLFNHASHTNITVTYDDANNKILLTGVAAQVQSNWTATTGLGVILNKPTLFSGSYTDLTNKPTLFSGSYTDLTNKPTIPTSFSSLVNGAHTLSLGSTGTVTFPDSTVQSTAYLAPTTGNNVISSAEPLTISRNGMTIKVTSAGMIQMSFNSVINITGRSSINNADSVVISSPNGVTTAGTQYNIGAVLALGDHLTATIVDHSFHRIYRLTVIIRSKDTTPGLELVVAYAIIEQIQ